MTCRQHVRSQDFGSKLGGGMDALTVRIRWAMVMRRELVNSSLIVRCTAESASKSMELVASSYERDETEFKVNSLRAMRQVETPLTMMMTLLCLNNALAMAINCLCPCEKFAPPALTLVVRLTTVSFCSTVALLAAAVADGSLAEAPLDVITFKCTRPMALKHSSSECSSNGSRFSLTKMYRERHPRDDRPWYTTRPAHRIVPENSTAS